MNIKLTTKFNDEEIRQDITHDFMKLAETKIMYLKDEHVRGALKELGWISPEEAVDNNKLKQELIKLSNHVYNWCEDIDEYGAGWDSWDDYYKDVYYNENKDVYKIVRKYINKEVK